MPTDLWIKAEESSKKWAGNMRLKNDEIREIVVKTAAVVFYFT